MQKTPQKQPQKPLAYFITFTCYGTWLHGNEKSSVDKRQNKIWTPYIQPNINWKSNIESKMLDKPYFLEKQQRLVVLRSILETCKWFNWRVFAAHVRTNHVHLVLNAAESPEIVLHRIKSAASNKLKQIELDNIRIKRWTRHGSTRYLWDVKDVSVVMHYVVNMQGEKMEYYEEPI